MITESAQRKTKKPANRSAANAKRSVPELEEDIVAPNRTSTLGPSAASKPFTPGKTYPAAAATTVAPVANPETPAPWERPAKAALMETMVTLATTVQQRFVAVMKAVYGLEK
jgi:hypothetical protein